MTKDEIERGKIYASLPFDNLPLSGYVDFLHFIGCNKPAIRLYLPSILNRQKLQLWCELHNYNFVCDEDHYICISRESFIAETVLLVDQMPDAHEYLLGILLGYPKCCCEHIANLGEENIDNFEAVTTKWLFSNKYQFINPIDYVSGTSLVCHLPCSPTCDKSLELALKALNFVQCNSSLSCFEPWLPWLNKW